MKAIAKHPKRLLDEGEALVAGCQLDALGEALQREDGERAAAKVGLIDYFEPPFGDDDGF